MWRVTSAVNLSHPRGSWSPNTCRLEDLSTSVSALAIWQHSRIHSGEMGVYRYLSDPMAR